MPTIPPIKIRNLGIYGVIRQKEVTDYLIPDGAVTEAINLMFDSKGAVTLRPGTTLIDAQISNNYACLGLFDALFSDSSLNVPLAVFSDDTNNDIYSYDSGAWGKVLQDDTSGYKTRFVMFSDRVVRVNGVDNMKVWDGNGAWDTSGSPINPQSMNSYKTKYIEVYKSRIYTAGNSSYPDRLFFSSVVNSSGVVTWTTSTDYVDINPNDGENISALKRFSLELLVFKPNYIYRFRTSGTDPDPLIKIGTRSQESVIEGKRGVYFHHESGIYLYSGGYPKEISRPISDFIEAIPLSYYDDVSSWNDENHIYFSIGDVTVGGVSFTNIVLRYTESSEVWTIYSYPTEFRAGSSYNNGTTLQQMVGDDDGNVFTFNTGTTDNGTAISYRLITKWYELGSVADTKVLQQMIGLCEKAQGSLLRYQTDDNAEWQPLGQLRKYVNYFDTSIKCHRIRFKLDGMSSQEAFVFQGIEIIKALNEGIIKE